MKRSTLLIFGLFLLFATYMVAQTDSIGVSFPQKFDFSNLSAAYNTGQWIISTVLALAMGYLSAYVPFLKNISNTGKRVIVAVVPLLIVVALFGFGNDVKTMIFNVLAGLITGNMVYDKVMEPLGIKSPKTRKIRKSL
jgi:hypothetical protein